MIPTMWLTALLHLLLLLAAPTSVKQAISSNKQVPCNSHDSHHVLEGPAPPAAVLEPVQVLRLLQDRHVTLSQQQQQQGQQQQGGVN
jgi:hypothetical protein